MQLKKKIRSIWEDYDAMIMTLLGLIVAFGLLLLPKLGSLVPTLSENAEKIGVASGKLVYQNPLYLPQKTPQYMLHKLDEGNITLLRATSVVVIIIATLALFFALNKWHTTRLAFAGSLLFVTSTFVLHEARSANQAGMYLLVVPLLILVGTWLKSKKNVNKLPWAVLIVSTLLYIPSIWIFIIIPTVIYRQRLTLAWKAISKNRKIVSMLVGLITILPLIYSFIINPAIIIHWLGLGENINSAQILNNLTGLPNQLFLTGPDTASTWVVGTPIIDVFTLAMLVLGVFSYSRGHHPLRARLLLMYSLLSVFVISLGMASIGLIIPIIYILVTNGIANMLQSWFVVFPRNPFARSVGVILMSVAIIITCRYHILRYYDAWPSLESTKHALTVVQ